MTDREFNEYIVEVRARMMRFAITILGHREDAEDVVAQVVERLYLRRESLNKGSLARAFAMTAVRNGCYDHIRYRRLHHSEQLAEGADNGQQSELSRDRIELVRWAMKQLAERQREVLHLKDIEGYTTSEIAQIYQTSHANIRVILSRARMQLRDIIVKTMQR